MQTTHATTQERTATDQTIPAYVPLGTDSAGADHVHRTADNTIHVVDADGSREIYAIDATPLPDWHAWIDHVDRQRGWLELSTAAVIAGGLGDA